MIDHGTTAVLQITPSTVGAGTLALASDFARDTSTVTVTPRSTNIIPKDAKIQVRFPSSTFVGVAVTSPPTTVTGLDGGLDVAGATAMTDADTGFIIVTRGRATERAPRHHPTRQCL